MRPFRFVTTFAALGVSFTLGLFLMFAGTVKVIATFQQSPKLEYIKQFDEHTYIITINGETSTAYDLTKTKEIKANEIKVHEYEIEIPKLKDSLARDAVDLTKEKQNVIDERVRAGKFESMYNDQVKLSGQCFDLLKHGGGRVGRFLDNPLIRTGISVGFNAAQLAKCK